MAVENVPVTSPIRAKHVCLVQACLVLANWDVGQKAYSLCRIRE